MKTSYESFKWEDFSDFDWDNRVPYSDSEDKKIWTGITRYFIIPGRDYLSYFHYKESYYFEGNATTGNHFSLAKAEIIDNHYALKIWKEKYDSSQHSEGELFSIKNISTPEIVIQKRLVEKLEDVIGVPKNKLEYRVTFLEEYQNLKKYYASERTHDKK